MVIIRLHRAIADKVVDGRIGSSWVGWLTFFCCSNSVKVAHFLAIIVVFVKDSVLVDGLVQNCICVDRMYSLQNTIHGLAGHNIQSNLRFYWFYAIVYRTVDQAAEAARLA